jgi:hypothetical protein
MDFRELFTLKSKFLKYCANKEHFVNVFMIVFFSFFLSLSLPFYVVLCVSVAPMTRFSLAKESHLGFVLAHMIYNIYIENRYT